MAAGKSLVQATIIWELHAGPLHLRCLPESDGASVFVVQARGDKGWGQVASGTDPLALFRKVAMLPATARAMKVGG